jgi:hypothetical protein
MAHPTDYASMRDISKLSKSPSTMNRKSMKTIDTLLSEEHAITLARNFLHQNPNWAIDSLVSYLMTQYADFGMTKEIISNQIKAYIMSR